MLALEDLSKQREPGAGKIELIFEDSQGDPARGVTVYRKLVAEGMRIVVTQNSNVALPISQLVNKDKVLQMGISVTSDRYSTPDDLTFRVNGTTRFEAERMVQFTAERLSSRPGKVAVITLLDEYPDRLRENVNGELAKRKIIPEFTAAFMPQEFDFRAIVSKLKNLNISEVLFRRCGAA